jgi:hypothetical protein
MNIYRGYGAFRGIHPGRDEALSRLRLSGAHID